MKINNIHLFLLISLALYMPAKSNGQLFHHKQEVIILHTNDMHARFDNFSKLAYLADSLRKTHPHVFLVAAGDNFTGNPIVDTYPDKGYPMIDVMNMLHYDVTAVGNHEFDLGQETLNKRREQATFPFISCNIDATGAVCKPFEPYVILKAGKLQIPFLGVIQLGDNGLPDSHPSRLTDLKFTPGIEKVKDFTWLKDKYGMLICLSHLGLDDDQPLAKAYPQIDLIIGGHSHTTMQKPLFVNNTMIVQAGSGLRYVGKLTLQVKKKKIVERKYELIALNDIKNSDPNIQDVINKYNDNPELNRIVAVAEAAFENQEELGCMMTDAIVKRNNIDFAFQNVGGIRISNLPQGNILVKDILKLDPFGNQVVLFNMTYDEIKSLISYAFNKDKKIDLICSGLTYTVITDVMGNCIDVEMKDMNGKLLDAGKTYKIGVNSYISASYKFNHSDPGTVNYNTSAQTLLDYLAEVKKVNYFNAKRTFVNKK